MPNHSQNSRNLIAHVRVTRIGAFSKALFVLRQLQKVIVVLCTVHSFGCSHHHQIMQFSYHIQ